MTPGAHDGGKGTPVDPSSAAALAGSVVDILWALGTPIANVIKRRLLRRKLRKVIARVSVDFAAEHPAVAEAMAASDEAIAHELARLIGAGRLLAPKVLADQWKASGGLDPADASQFATEYVQALQDELLKIDGFRPLLKSGAAVTTAETLQRIEEALRTREERGLATAYFDAADEYVHAALARLDGDAIGAIRSAHDARSLAEKAEISGGDWQVIEKLRDLREGFKEFVEGRFDEFEAAYESEDPMAIQAAFEALEQGAREFQALVRKRLF